MDISILCILIAAVLPYVWVSYAKFSKKGYDNRAPREFLDKQEGRIKRAYNAHLNSFEAFPAFAIAIILGHLTNVSQIALSALASIFIICRILYGIFYIIDKPALRSTVWGCGFLCVIVLYILALIFV